ncbi:unnamed protein product [Arctia plantaginis]|uniref:C2H2-type domain-containing protein n=1 Tax=Arctia plantaginis TaxID=874455 RepID=A0A8S0ZRW5_ARCPL|nr:unnamed protein product [Arctia plantaginis]CAB3235897.1 unnamed protein product [Arctia plantaginis]
MEVKADEKLKQLGMEKVMEYLHTRKVYRCTYQGCKADFDRPYRLTQHILAHNNIRPYLCDQPNCGKAYTSKSHLDRHLRTVHMPQETDVVYSCPKCFKTFANRQNLKRHLNTVHELEYACEICDKQFKKKNQLSAHMYQHTGVKAFSCDQCQETFVSLYLKKRHMRYHKVYLCHECKVEYNHWSKYQQHLKAEHQNDEYICDECGRAFKQRCHIVRHVKIHSHLNRIFHCPYENCERYYSRNSNLKQHILVKHLDMLFECTVCGSRLSTKAKLNYHLNLHYNAGVEKPVPKLTKPDRKERKDKDSFRASTALKLAGLAKAPDDLNETSSGFSEPQDDLRSTLSSSSDVPENLRSNEAHSSKKTGNAQLGSKSPPPVNLTVKTEYIEVEVDIPYDI